MRNPILKNKNSIYAEDVPEKGTAGFWYFNFHRGKDDQMLPLHKCICGRIWNLSNHSISQTGVLYPSVLCSDCGQHIFAYLADWNPGWDKKKGEFYCEMRHKREKSDE